MKQLLLSLAWVKVRVGLFTGFHLELGFNGEGAGEGGVGGGIGFDLDGLLSDDEDEPEDRRIGF